MENFLFNHFEGLHFLYCGGLNIICFDSADYIRNWVGLTNFGFHFLKLCLICLLQRF
jgi:hypothetical protein